MTATAIRASFREQAAFCEKLGSPFTARLLTVLEVMLDDTTPVGAAVLGWRGDASAFGDGLALRLAGALQALVLAGRAPGLAALYPPHPLPSEAAMRPVLASALADHSPAILAALRFAPQTNETARAGALFPGLVTIARMTGARLALYEIGASAGLNLAMDRFAYRLGGREFGNPESEPLIAPDWAGPPPAGPHPEVVSRQGCDLNPLDIRSEGERARLRSFIWPDQPARIARFEAAVRTALAMPCLLEPSDAADWVERNLTFADADGLCPVLYHSIAFQYFPPESQRRITSHMQRIGAAATAARPLAWLAFEQVDDKGAHLVLRLWPGGAFRVLAKAGPHVPKVEWFGPDFPEGDTLAEAMAKRPA